MEEPTFLGYIYGHADTPDTLFYKVFLRRGYFIKEVENSVPSVPACQDIYPKKTQ